MGKNKPANSDVASHDDYHNVAEFFKELVGVTLDKINQDKRLDKPELDQNKININEYNLLSLGARKLVAHEMVSIELFLENVPQETRKGEKKYTLKDLRAQNIDESKKLQELLKLPKPPEKHEVHVGNMPILMDMEAAKLLLGDVGYAIKEIENGRKFFIKPGDEEELSSRVTGGHNASRAEAVKPTPVSVAKTQGKNPNLLG